MKWIAKDISDSENVAATHPRVDILKLLSRQRDYDTYCLCKDLSLNYKTCYSHLKMLEKYGLIGGHLKYHITDKARQILSRLESESS